MPAGKIYRIVPSSPPPKNVKKRPKSATYKRRQNTNRFIAKRLGDGVQYHKTAYGETVTMTVGGTATWYNADFVRDIPKYRNDPTASARQANLQICRLRDKIYVKGMKFRLGVANLDPNQSVCLRTIFLRNSAWDENVDTGAGNWYESVVDGSYVLPSSSMPTALIQHFNMDLLRDKKKDLFFDKKIILAPTGGSTGASCAYREFYVPINQLAIFESKGDAASADDLTNGRYWILFSVSSNDGAATGDIKMNYTCDFIWSEN